MGNFQNLNFIKFHKMEHDEWPLLTFHTLYKTINF